VGHWSAPALATLAFVWVSALAVGLYAGALIGCGAVLLGPPWARGRAGPGRPSGRLLALTLAAALPTAITFALEHGFGWPITNLMRAVAAVPLGAMVASVVTGRVATLHYVECAPRRPIAQVPPRPPAST
jgi:hypothetical protein